LLNTLKTLKPKRTNIMRLTTAFLTLGLGCGEGTAPPAPVFSVTINATNAVELVPGGTQMLSATPKDSKGKPLTDRVTTWSTSDPEKVTVVSGLVSGVALGTANITASSEGKTATITVTVKDGGVISPAGTNFSTQGGAVAVSVPAGAVAQTTSLTVSPAANPPANIRLMPGTAFDFGPPGATFVQPISITIKYNPADVASDTPESGLQLYEVVGSAWRVVAGSTVDLTAKTVTGATSHVGTFAVMMQPHVATVTVGGDVTPMPVVTTRQLTAILKDNEGTTLDRPATWSSDNSAVLSVDANGVVTSKIPGTAIITASAEGKSGTASITVIPGPPAKIIANAGDNQSVAAGAVVPVAPSVKVTDAGDNPIANVAITFAVASGGGTITGASATTNESGIATVGSWTLGAAAGPNTLTASSPTISGVTVTFQAAGGAGPPANIVAFAGNNQTGTAGGNIANAPSVKVTDANGNFVAGFTVTFAPGTGSGSVTGGSAVSNSSGIATVGSWKLGITPGAQTLIATASGLNGSPITFNATAVAPIPAAVAGFAGNNQTARPGTAVPTPISVIVTDAVGIPVPGAQVDFAIQTGGGTANPSTTTTDANGIATTVWTLGPTIGANSLFAGIPGGFPPVTFNATASTPPATRILINAGDNQTASAGQPVPIAPSVKVVDAEGIGVAGVSVVFSLRSGDGSLQGANAVSNVDGIATLGQWVLGIGGNSIFATVTGLQNSPLVFVALGTAEVQIVTFGDSNTDLGFTGTNTQPKVGSYISSTNPAIKLGANSPNDATQLAGKIESRWKANSTKTIKAVNHGIAGTSSGGGRTILQAPNALLSVNGVTRFQGEVLGDAYPWSGGEPVNEFYPSGAIQRVQAFKPRTSDFAYISIGTNDLADGVSPETVKINLETMIDSWIARGLAPNRLMITTLPPRGVGQSSQVPILNAKIRTLAQSKGVRLIDIAAFVSDGDGLTWKASSGNPSYPGALHVTNDELHYSEVVRNWIADQVVSIMLSFN
jgi:adhesin/invasin